MRKVIFWIGTSLDGYTSGPKEQLDWLVPHASQPEAMTAFKPLRDRCDTILVGRVNYQGFSDYWPKVPNNPQAPTAEVELSKWLDQTQKVVFSRTLKEVKWQNTRLATRSPEEEVAALKRSGGKDLMLQNSTRLAQSLFAADLIDELAVTVAPVAVGAGRSLFAGIPRHVELGVPKLTPFESGAFLAHYTVRHRG